MQFIWRLLTGCDWQESRTELRHYYSSHRKRIAWLLVALLGLILLVHLLNNQFGPIPAIPNPTIPEWLEFSRHTSISFTWLEFIGLVVVMMLLPPTAHYPLELTQSALLPRRICCVLLSLPIAVSYAMETTGSPYLFSGALYWRASMIELGLLMPRVVIPVAVLASFLGGFKVSWRFIVAAGAWTICHAIISIVEWSVIPVDVSGMQISYPPEIAGYTIAFCACLLLLWRPARWPVFVLGCLLTALCHTLSSSVFLLTGNWYADAWIFSVIWGFNWFAAGAIGMIPRNWTIIV